MYSKLPVEIGNLKRRTNCLNWQLWMSLGIYLGILHVNTPSYWLIELSKPLQYELQFPKTFSAITANRTYSYITVIKYIIPDFGY